VNLDDLYSRLPVVPCKGLCGREVCAEAVPLNREELRRVQAAIGGELPDAPHAGCALLDADGRCAAYEVRPFICRLFGAQPRETAPWRCPHGCRAPGPEPSLFDVAALLRAADYYGEGILSTNRYLNGRLEAAGAVSWHFEGPDLVMAVPEPGRGGGR
jgi:hypothetical protein